MNRRIVIIDEDKDIVEQVSNTLKHDSYTCVAPGTSAQAVAEMHREPAWLLIVGEYLPDGSGIQLLQELEVPMRHPHKNPIAPPPERFGILLLHRPRFDFENRNAQWTFLDAPDLYLQKPFHPEELRGFVRRLCAFIEQEGSEYLTSWNR